MWLVLLGCIDSSGPSLGERMLFSYTRVLTGTRPESSGDEWKEMKRKEKKRKEKKRKEKKRKEKKRK